MGYGFYPTPWFHISNSASLRGIKSPRCGWDNIAYPTAIHGIWRFISHRSDFIPRSEAEWDI